MNEKREFSHYTPYVVSQTQQSYLFRLLQCKLYGCIIHESNLLSDAAYRAQNYNWLLQASKNNALKNKTNYFHAKEKLLFHQCEVVSLFTTDD